MFLINLVILLAIATASANSTTKIPQVDHVIDSLSRQQWDEDEATCQIKIFNLLNNVKNSTLWATWVWDSNPKAPYGTFYGARFHLGNYDQCLRPPWLPEHPELRTQYCLADIEMSKNPGVKNWNLPGPYGRADKYYVDGGTPTGRSFSYMSYGVCLPVDCQTKSVAKYVKALLTQQHLQAAWDADVKIHHCEEAGAPRVVPKGYYVYKYTFAALVIIALASTYYTREYPEKAKTNTFVNHVAQSFCLYRNWGSVCKEDKDAMPYLDGIRFLTMVVIVVGHVGFYGGLTSVANDIEFDKKLEVFKSALFMVHLDLTVDTFFAMAAFLLGRSLATLDTRKPNNLLKLTVKRYIRLFGAYVVVIFYIAYIVQQTDNGPLYPKLLKSEHQSCEKNWWVSLLMIGNYVDIDNMCYTVSWYIPCDFHFYVVTVTLLYVYQKNQKVGKVATAIVVLLGFLGPAINVYLYDLPAINTLTSGVGVNNRYLKNFKKGYIHTHIRMGPYIAGLLVGYLTSVYKPADHKKKWSKTASFLGVCAGLSMMVSVFAAGALCHQYRVYGLLVGVYKMLDRTVFASGVLCIVIFCTYGDVPLVNSFLSWSPFRSLSRLTYGVYLIHPLLILKSKLAARSHLRFHLADALVEGLGTLVMALMLSAVVWLLVEAPLVNITNKYLDSRSVTKKTVNVIGNGASQEAVAENIADKPKVM